MVCKSVLISLLGTFSAIFVLRPSTPTISPFRCSIRICWSLFVPSPLIVFARSDITFNLSAVPYEGWQTYDAPRIPLYSHKFNTEYAGRQKDLPGRTSRTRWYTNNWCMHQLSWSSRIRWFCSEPLPENVFRFYGSDVKPVYWQTSTSMINETLWLVIRQQCKLGSFLDCMKRNR